MDVTPTAIALTALAAGYILGRARLGHRASDWAHWLTYRTTPVTRQDWRWWAAQVVFAVEIAAMLAATRSAPSRRGSTATTRPRPAAPHPRSAASPRPPRSPPREP